MKTFASLLVILVLLISAALVWSLAGTPGAALFISTTIAMTEGIVD